MKILDTGWKKPLRKVLGIERLEGVKVGVLSRDFDAATKDGKTSVGLIATVHEFGLGVPRRSWLRDWFDGSRARAQSAMVTLLQKNPTNVERAFEQLGLWAVGQIQQRIARRIPPPNSDATIARKGSDVPLIDTGQLRSSITYQVVKK